MINFMVYNKQIKWKPCVYMLLFILVTFSFNSCEKTTDESLQVIDPLITDDLHKKTFSSPVQLLFAENIDESSYTVLLNNKIISVSTPVTLEDPGFYELLITSTNSQLTDSILFVIQSESRGDSEWGLPEFTPTDFESSSLSLEEVQFIYPKNRYAAVPIPVCMKLSDVDTSYKSKYYQVNYETSNAVEYLRQGIGSVKLAIKDEYTSIDLEIGAKSFNLPINLPTSDTLQIPSIINGGYEIPANTSVILDEDLTINEGGHLIINEGCLILLDEAININNFGNISIRGEAINPVYFTCKSDGEFWGGFINKGANLVDINYCFFTSSGYHTSEEYQWGHAKQQALFYCENTTFTIENSYMIDNSGQIFYTTDTELMIKNCLVQRSKTGGQQNSSELTIDSSFFMDLPYREHQFLDDDNDGLYLAECDAVISNSAFLFIKDDGIDSGASSGGDVTINNCHFEGIFHEGLALSSSYAVYKSHYVTNSTFTNCGQGIELGYSSSNHMVNVDNCSFYDNAVGIRYGDNYSREYNGIVHVSNSTSYNNHFKDVWNMVHTDWTGHYKKLSFSNTSVSNYNPNYPDLTLME